MPLSQIQIIQSLGEALQWLKKEIEWKTQLQELRHLTGRIGELYVALITRGQMSPEINQRGYDVVSETGEKISVKTTTVFPAGHVQFNVNTLSEVNRVIIIYISGVGGNEDDDEISIKILFDGSKAQAEKLIDPHGQIPFARLRQADAQAQDIKVSSEAKYKNFCIQELENGSIRVLEGNQIANIVKPMLRRIAVDLNIEVISPSDIEYTTRQLGMRLIRHINMASPHEHLE